MTSAEDCEQYCDQEPLCMAVEHNLVYKLVGGAWNLYGGCSMYAYFGKWDWTFCPGTLDGPAGSGWSFDEGYMYGDPAEVLWDSPYVKGLPWNESAHGNNTDFRNVRCSVRVPEIEFGRKYPLAYEGQCRTYELASGANCTVDSDRVGGFSANLTMDDCTKFCDAQESCTAFSFGSLVARPTTQCTLYVDHYSSLGDCLEAGGLGDLWTLLGADVGYLVGSPYVTGEVMVNASEASEDIPPIPSKSSTKPSTTIPSAKQDSYYRAPVVNWLSSLCGGVMPSWWPASDVCLAGSKRRTLLQEKEQGVKLRCPSANDTITRVLFASYGTPSPCDGNSDSDVASLLGSCHYGRTLGIVEQLCVGNNSCEVFPGGPEWGEDPCFAETKRLTVSVECGVVETEDDEDDEDDAEEGAKMAVQAATSFVMAAGAASSLATVGGSGGVAGEMGGTTLLLFSGLPTDIGSALGTAADGMEWLNYNVGLFEDTIKETTDYFWVIPGSASPASTRHLSAYTEPTKIEQHELDNWEYDGYVVVGDDRSVVDREDPWGLAGSTLVGCFVVMLVSVLIHTILLTIYARCPGLGSTNPLPTLLVHPRLEFILFTTMVTGLGRVAGSLMGYNSFAGWVAGLTIFLMVVVYVTLVTKLIYKIAEQNEITPLEFRRKDQLQSAIERFGLFFEQNQGISDVAIMFYVFDLLRSFASALVIGFLAGGNYAEDHAATYFGMAEELQGAMVMFLIVSVAAQILLNGSDNFLALYDNIIGKSTQQKDKLAGVILARSMISSKGWNVNVQHYAKIFPETMHVEDEQQVV
eukprot:gene1499-2127_t